MAQHPTSPGAGPCFVFCGPLRSSGDSDDGVLGSVAHAGCGAQVQGGSHAAHRCHPMPDGGGRATGPALIPLRRGGVSAAIRCACECACDLASTRARVSHASREHVQLRFSTRPAAILEAPPHQLAPVQALDLEGRGLHLRVELHLRLLGHGQLRCLLLGSGGCMGQSQVSCLGGGWGGVGCR